MNQFNPSHSYKPPGPEWQLVCEILLPLHADGVEAIHNLMKEKFELLQLPERLINRIEKSIQEILERAQSVRTGFERIHLFLFAPIDHNAKAGSWGFFRIEKLDGENDRETRPGHAVEIYLYMEGS